MNGNPYLIAHLQQLIHERGRIAFSDYMAEVLYHPEHGYYSRELGAIGPEGDFYTAANVDPAMGSLLAKLFDRMADGMDHFVLIEIGAGTGLLARHILQCRPFPYIIVERSPVMRTRQRETLETFEVEWRDQLPEGVHGCIFSNEFFDALPVRRFVRRGRELQEIFVTDGFSQVEGEPDVRLKLPLLGDGCLADVSLEAREWVHRIGRSIQCGYHLAIDYGHLREELFARPRGTLMCYRRHWADEDPYAAIGEKDITAHVNFSDLIDEGAEEGLEEVGYRTQMEFLIDLGLLDMMQPLAERADPASIQRLQALKNLLLPPMMGERFKVLLQRKGVPRVDLPGFGERAPF